MKAASEQTRRQWVSKPVRPRPSVSGTAGTSGASAGRARKRRKPALKQAPSFENRRARYDFEVTKTYEAGLVLRGTEVKAARCGDLNLKQAFADVQGGELWLRACHIAHYPHAHRSLQHAPRRDRKLLLHKRELNQIIGAIQREHMTCVPLRAYFNDDQILKIQIGLAKGKRKIDKRHAIKEREWNLRRRKLGL